MSWYTDNNNVVHMIALGVAEREFGQYIEQGLGTREQFADVILLYSHRNPGLSLGDLTDRLLEVLELWLMENKTLADLKTALSSGTLQT